MCSQNAKYVIPAPLIKKKFRGACLRTLGVNKYEPSPQTKPKLYTCGNERYTNQFCYA